MESGFALYDRSHLVWLVLCALIVILPAAAVSRIPEGRRGLFLKILAVLIGVVHILQALCRIRLGMYDIGSLPLHFCAVTAYFAVIHGFFPMAFLEGELFFPGLPGVVLALIFPDWTEYAPFSALSFYGFFGHALIAAYLICRIRMGALRPSRRLWPYSVVFFIGYFLLVYPFDRHFRVNYGFLLWPSAGSPLELLSGLDGTMYRLAYMGALLALTALWYLIWSAARGEIRRKGNVRRPHEPDRDPKRL